MLIEERANENREMTAVLTYVKQQAASALQKKMVLFINLLGKGLTQEINGDGGSIYRAPAGEHFMKINQFIACLFVEIQVHWLE